jgi:hypothetical protein
VLILQAVSQLPLGGAAIRRRQTELVAGFRGQLDRKKRSRILTFFPGELKTDQSTAETKQIGSMPGDAATQDDFFRT